MNATPNPGVNVVSLSANIHHEQALGIEHSNATERERDIFIYRTTIKQET